MKRNLCLMLVLCMMISMLPVQVFAASIVNSGICGDNLTWTLDDNGTLIISGTGEMFDYSSNSAPWHNAGVPFKRIIIEEGVTSVGRNAFGANYGSVWLTVIPSTLTRIGSQAFMCGSRCVVINSETVASQAKTYDTIGYLLYLSNTVLIREGLSYGNYVTNGRTYSSNAEFQGVRYTMFSECKKHSYKQFDTLEMELLMCDKCSAIRDFSALN
ncbi:MAG: hypothetical protein J6Q54_02830, partial [Oscillospiraceae bacterium]|nr:hypothetical protein [Oscillospiraceae bacterium]